MTVEADAAAFNAKCPPGTRVAYRLRDGRCRAAVTLTRAAVLRNGAVAVWLSRVNDWVAIERVIVEGPQ